MATLSQSYLIMAELNHYHSKINFIQALQKSIKMMQNYKINYFSLQLLLFLRIELIAALISITIYLLIRILYIDQWLPLLKNFIHKSFENE